jgi:hypothetical protein
LPKFKFSITTISASKTFDILVPEGNRVQLLVPVEFAAFFRFRMGVVPFIALRLSCLLRNLYSFISDLLPGACRQWDIPLSCGVKAKRYGCAIFDCL